jgi:hypothetical protein
LPSGYIEITNRLTEISLLIKELEKRKEMEKLSIENLEKENRELRKLLDDKYSAKELLVIFCFISIALGLSLVGWFTLNIKLIHPAISIPILIGSIGFIILTIWRLME